MYSIKNLDLVVCKVEDAPNAVAARLHEGRPVTGVVAIWDPFASEANPNGLVLGCPLIAVRCPEGRDIHSEEEVQIKYSLRRAFGFVGAHAHKNGGEAVIVICCHSRETRSPTFALLLRCAVAQMNNENLASCVDVFLRDLGRDHAIRMDIVVAGVEELALGEGLIGDLKRRFSAGRVQLFGDEYRGAHSVRRDPRSKRFDPQSRL